MFYSRFMPHHSTILAPVHNLLKKDALWKWSKVDENAFLAVKELMLNSQTLVHYDDTSLIYLSCDASCYVVGAVLFHKMSDHRDLVSLFEPQNSVPAHAATRLQRWATIQLQH